ncbi:MAG TPA: LysR family transcriptional regulator [Ilumatobacter sp.]|nr:LysR family transcriptional regulator [Ilumatobacter sp.]
MSTGLPDISLRQLEYLTAVVDSPTWAAAANRVGVSASALSQGLAELERRVGVELFESHGRRRILRPSAAPVLDHARRVVALTGDLVDWSQRIRTAHGGRVRLGMIDIAAVVHFPTVLQEFRAEFPDVELTLSVAPSAQLLDALRDGQIDIVVCVAPPSVRPGIATAPLFDEALRVIAPASARIGDAASWGPWLMFPGDSHTRHLIEERLRQLGAPIVIAAASHQPEVLHQMARLGLGWAVLPVAQTNATDDVAAGGVVAGPELVHRQLVVARRSESVTDPAVDELDRRLHQRV